MAIKAPLRSFLSRRLAIHGSYGTPSALAAALGDLAWGTITAAATHFSAIAWSSRSMVETISSPPRSRTGHVSASSPHSRRTSSRRTWRTNWGSFHSVERWAARTTFSALAAAKSSAPNASPVSGVPPAAIWSRM